MKIMVASDIHGSYYYCKKLVECYKQSGAQKLLLLGDILYHGPRNDLPREYEPKKVIDLLNSMKNEIHCFRGNCDTEVDGMVLDFPILADYAILFDGRNTVYATHGHIYNKDNLPPLSDGDVLLHGHTHIPVCEAVGHITVMNPGSVSIPKEESWHGYMIIENGKYSWLDFDGHKYKLAAVEHCTVLEDKFPL